MGPFVKKMVFVCVKPCVKYCVYTRRAKMGVPPEKTPKPYPTSSQKETQNKERQTKVCPSFRSNPKLIYKFLHFSSLLFSLSYALSSSITSQSLL